MFVIINREGRFKRVFGYTWIAANALLYVSKALAWQDCKAGEWPIPYADTI